MQCIKNTTGKKEGEKEGGGEGGGRNNMSNLAWCYERGRRRGDDEVNDDGEGSKNQMTADKRLEIKCDRPPRNESEVPSGCLELERKMGVGGVRYRF